MKVRILKTVTGKMNKNGKQVLTINPSELMDYTFANIGDVVIGEPTSKVYGTPSGLVWCVNASGYNFLVSSNNCEVVR